MMHHYGYSIKRGVLPFIRGTWYRLSTAIRCNIENGYAALTLLTMKTWRHLTVEKQIKQHADTWLKEKYGMLTFDDYQTSAKGTAIYPKQYRLMYPALGLAGEAGEVANKIKKNGKSSTVICNSIPVRNGCSILYTSNVWTIYYLRYIRKLLKMLILGV